MDTVEYIQRNFRLDLAQPSPIEIANTGRDQLASLFAELHFNRGAEIGVRDGTYSELLCKVNPLLKLYCVDPYMPYAEYRETGTQETMDQWFSEACNKLALFNCSFIRKMSAAAADEFSNESLDFVYIDANHAFPSVVQDIHLWQAKVRSGGIVSGHDFRRYFKSPTYQVWPAVTGYTMAYQIHPWFVLGRYHEPAGNIRETWRSWFWVKR